LFLILFLVLSLAPRISSATVGAPAWLENAKVDRVINVDNNHPKGSDNNPGTVDLPLSTISAAADLAVRLRHTGFSTKVLISPGVYREQVTLSSPNQKRDVPIIFEAKEPGKTVISGSDIWTDWRMKREHIYVHSWPFKWGLAPYPRGWEGHVKLDPIVRRREMVFINGTPLEQTLSLSTLRANSFFVSEDTGELYVYPPSGTNLSDARVEVALRSGLFLVTASDNIALKGMIFEHDTTAVQGSAVLFSNSNHILIEDCIFRWNTWTGLGFSNVRSVTVRRSSANNNGGAGWTAWRVKNMLSENSETSFNNWRGERGGFLGWGIAGFKHLQMHGAIYRNHISQGNRTRGVWFDFDNTDIVLEGSRLCGNLGDGIDIEASQGPITIKDSRINDNSGSGIFSTNSQRVRIENSFIQRNKIAQIRIAGNAEREVNNWETKEAILLRVDHWALRNSLLEGTADGFLLETVRWPHFFESLVSDRNVWIGTTTQKGFKVDRKVLTFPEWQELTKQEANSNFRKPDLESVAAPSSSCS
jgi:hypothetical protein